jgi:hypothetical protein
VKDVSVRISDRRRHHDLAERAALRIPDRFDALECRAEGVPFPGQIAVETRAAHLRRRLDLWRPRIDRKFGNLPASNAPCSAQDPIGAGAALSAAHPDDSTGLVEGSFDQRRRFGAEKQCFVK